MAEARKSVQKARLVSKGRENEGTKGEKYVLKYIRLDGDNAGKESTAGKLVAHYTEAEQTFIRALKEGDEFVLTKVEYSYTGKDGNTRNGWNLDTVADISTWVEKPRKEKTWDVDKDHRILAMNSMKNAVASLGEGHSAQAYKERALELADATTEVFTMLKNKSAPAQSPVYSNNTVLDKPNEVTVDTFDDIPDFGD